MLGIHFYWERQTRLPPVAPVGVTALHLICVVRVTAFTGLHGLHTKSCGGDNQEMQGRALRGTGASQEGGRASAVGCAAAVAHKRF